MRARLLCLGILAACKTNDSTDISGTYAGNATYTISPTTGDGSVGAASASLVVAADDDNNVQVGVAPTCVLDGTQITQLTLYDNGGNNRFIFTSASVASDQSCTLPIDSGALAISIVEGDLVVDHGLTLTLELGGTITSSPDPTDVDGYAVYRFDGEQ
jgi:hypothetical protein